MRNRFVGRGILDASMAHSVRSRQGCRLLRQWGWIASASGGTHRSRPTNVDGLPCVVCEAVTLLQTVQHKAAVLHPLTGWGRQPLALPGIAPSADGAMDDWGFRAVCGAGVSLAAASGYFARCGGRPGLCPWTPRFFEKNRVKLLSFSHFL